jgi:hypothetical protein
LPSKSNLFFGTDGTLYANDSKSLRAVIPQYMLSEATRDTHIYSPTHLHVGGTAVGQKEWELKANGNIIFSKGFSVKKGTRLKAVPGGK